MPGSQHQAGPCCRQQPVPTFHTASAVVTPQHANPARRCCCLRLSSCWCRHWRHVLPSCFVKAHVIGSPAAPLTPNRLPASLLQELAAFLREDLPHLFDDQGIDASRYDEAVVFEDPITYYSNIKGGSCLDVQKQQ